MKRLSVVVAAVLGVALVQFSVQSTPAPSRASQEALAFQAHAAFQKYISSHAPLIRAHAPTRGSAPLIHPRAAAPAVATNGVQPLPSVNWSGYADVETGTKTATAVSGRWTIPHVTCLQGSYRNQDAFAAQWVGLDGATNQTVEQLGTGEQCYEGQLYYYVWYEMFPNGSVQEGTQACINNNVDCPRPGDQISASVTATPGSAGVNNYTLALRDYTTSGNNFSVTQPCATEVCLDQSAEWIIERPAFSLPFGFQILPLVDYDQNAFTSGTVVSGGAASSIAGFQGGTVYDIPMIDDSASYYLDCVGQSGRPGQLLLVSDANACPTVSPGPNGSFNALWDSSF
jgi:Peptidase A4 family